MFLNDEHIKELYNCQSPKQESIKVMKCILILFQKDDKNQSLDWKKACTFLRTPKFKEKLRSFEINSISQSKIDQIQTI